MGYKVYISGPMVGKDYKNRFAMAAVLLEQSGNIVVNPAKIVKPGMTIKEHTEATEELLDECDAILFLTGWKDIQKCHVEMGRAIQNEMIITFEGGRGCQSPSKPEHGILQKKPARKFIQGIKGVFSARKATTSHRK